MFWMTGVFRLRNPLGSLGFHVVYLILCIIMGIG